MYETGIITFKSHNKATGSIANAILPYTTHTGITGEEVFTVIM